MLSPPRFRSLFHRQDGVRLDWSEVRFKGKDGDAQKNKFLRLMGIHDFLFNTDRPTTIFAAPLLHPHLHAVWRTYSYSPAWTLI